METVSEPLARSLKHELTHSFLFQKRKAAVQSGCTKESRNGWKAGDQDQLRRNTGDVSERQRKILILPRGIVDEIIQFRSVVFLWWSLAIVESMKPVPA